MGVLLLSLAVLLVLSIPIAYAIGISSLLYFALYHPEAMRILPQRMFAGFNSYTLIALPLFIFMGFLMNEAGITARLINFCQMFVGRLRGGLALVNVAASMIFGGISGSSTSDTASVGSILFLVKPGITGLWQTSGRSSLSFEDRLNLDESYIRNWSLWMDIFILIKTIRVAVSGKGAF